MSQKISAVVNSKNSTATIERCLKSISWCDEVVVVDIASTDDTREVAARFTNKVIEHKDSSHVEPVRNFSISQATHQRVLLLDADEVVSPSLAKKLQTISSTDVAAYHIPRKNLIFGKWIQHAGWWPDYQIRFFKKTAVTFSDAIHQPPTVTGTLESLEPTEENAIIHHHYQSIEQFITRLNRYTSIEAEQTKSPTHPVIAFHHEFFRRFFKEQAYQARSYGEYLAALQSTFELVKTAKIGEQAGLENQSTLTPRQLNNLIKDYRYWLADWQLRRTHNPVSLLYWRLRRKLRI